MRNLQTKVTTEMYLAFQQGAQARGLTVSELLRGLVEDHLAGPPAPEREELTAESLARRYQQLNLDFQTYELRQALLPKHLRKLLAPMRRSLLS